MIQEGARKQPVPPDAGAELFHVIDPRVFERRLLDELCDLTTRVRTIAKSYAELYYLKRSTEITEDRIRLIQDLEQVAQSRYKAGSPMGPILQAQVELGRLEDRLVSLNDLEQPQKAKLNSALNRPATALPNRYGSLATVAAYTGLRWGGTRRPPSIRHRHASTTASCALRGGCPG